MRILLPSEPTPDRVLIEVGGSGLLLTTKDAIDLALALAHRAIGKSAKPSPVDGLALSGTLNALSLTIDRTAEGAALRETIRVSGDAAPWRAFAVELFALAAGNPDATLDDLLDSEFGGEDGDDAEPEGSTPSPVAPNGRG